MPGYSDDAHERLEEPYTLPPHKQRASMGWFARNQRTIWGVMGGIHISIGAQQLPEPAQCGWFAWRVAAGHLRQ